MFDEREVRAVHSCVGLWVLVSVWICLFPARHCSSPERLPAHCSHAGDIQANRVGRLASQTQPYSRPHPTPWPVLFPKIISLASQTQKRRPPTRAGRFIAALHTHHTAMPTIRATRANPQYAHLRLYMPHTSLAPGSGASRRSAHKHHVESE
jgi:hypothetical protein